MIARRGEVDPARLDRLVGLRFLHRHLQAVAEHLRQPALVVLRQVQHDGHRARERRAQVLQQGEQRIDAAGGGADRHQVGLEREALGQRPLHRASGSRRYRRSGRLTTSKRRA